MKFSYENCGFTIDQIKNIADRAAGYTEHLITVSDKNNYADPECSLVLPADNDLFKRSIRLAERLGSEKLTSEKAAPQSSTSKLKYILDIGIGGSNLGTKAVYDALFGYFDVIEPERYPKMIFADTNDPEYLSKLKVFLQKNINAAEEIIIVAISKSGGTTETMFNIETCLDAFSDSVLLSKILSERTVVISDEGSPFWDKAIANNIQTLPLPKMVGGRYSVFSPVGILPLEVCGINAADLRQGALDMRQKCLSKDLLSNPALISASILFLNYVGGKNINDNFIFHPELESVGKWYRQLMGESVGKATDLNGKTVNVGITPTVSIGSTDLHSVGQLYLGGPFDKLTTFISSTQSKPAPEDISENAGGSKHENNGESEQGADNDVALGKDLQFSGLVASIEGQAASTIMEAILKGTMQAYINESRPFTEIDLQSITPYSIGEFFQFKMMEMMYLGYLMNVNTFDQPNVESYKIETKRFLTSR